MKQPGYAISAGHELTLEAADEVLRAGGNALDAAVAAYAMTWVAEPCMSAAGGGGFALVHRPESETRLLDFFCQTPRHRRPLAEVDFFPIEVDFGDTREVFHVGQGSVAVPGAVKGLYALHQLGARMPMRDLLQPAMEAAKNGVRINPFQQLDFRLLEPIMRVSPLAKPLFFPNDQLIQVDDTMQLPGMADFLDYLWREGPNAFYQGELAHHIARLQAEQGGFLKEEDLLHYEVVHRVPQRFVYRDHQVHTNPTPATGGAILQHVLEKLHTETSMPPPESPESVCLLARHFEAAAREAVQTSRLPRHGSTTHFSVLDSQGMAVSLTASNGEGSGVFLPHTDIQLNNMLGESALLPNGFHSWLPDERLPSMMSPTMVLDESGRILHGVLGSGGAGRIPYAIAQVLYLKLHHGYSLEQAVQAPRLHLHNQELELEPGLDCHAPSAEWSLRYWKTSSLFFGGVHSLWSGGNNLEAAGDPRRDGVALVK